MLGYDIGAAIKNLEFVEFKIGNNDDIEAIDGLVEFQTIMCLDIMASNFCSNNEDPDVPSIPENECIYSANLDNYIISDGLCEYIVEVPIDPEGFVELSFDN